MNRDEARRKATALVDQMTVEEMTTQLRFDAKAIDRLGIPEYNWWNEGLHGVARAGVSTSFPQAIGMAATFDEEILQNVADIVSTEARAKYNTYKEENDLDIYKGLTLWSPNVNIFRDPRWGRGHETYGEDPYLTSRLGVSYVKGLQGDGENLKVAACAKHFAVHSGPEADRHHFNAIASKKDMRETYLPAFEACVKEGNVESVMGAYNRTNDEPCCAHEDLMVNILRNEWGFQGHYVSDCWAIKDFHENHMVTNNPRESVALAMSMGCDVNCGSTYLCMMQAYNEKLITKEQIRTSAIRLFTTRFLLGLFDGCELDNIPYNVVECKDHLDYSRKVAEKSLVLLKNDGLLPLDKSKLKAIAVVGPNANSRSALVGNYHGTSTRYWTVTEGLQNYLGDDVRVFYSEGCHLFKDRVEPLAKADDRISEAVIAAKNSDVVIVCVGLDETLEGEEGDTGNSYASGDKNDLNLPESQLKLIEAVKAVGKPVVLLNMTGSAMDLSCAKNDDRVSAIIQTWYPGAEGGKAIASCLFGDVSPSGKLPVTFYENLDGIADFTDYSMKGRTYRYIEGRAQYPFGYGLTYSKVVVTDAKVTDDIPTDLNTDTIINIEATVENQGDRDTDDVVEVYIKNIESPNAVRNHSLCGFKRVNVKKGGTAVVDIAINGKAFGAYNDEGELVFDSKKYVIYVGTSQPDEVSVELTGVKPAEIEINL